VGFLGVGFRWVYPKKPPDFFGYVPGCLNPAPKVPILARICFHIKAWLAENENVSRPAAREGRVAHVTTG